MKRFKANDWKENLDVDEFLELEKQIYLDMFPHKYLMIRRKII
jgi:hypothetical protein